MNLFTVFTCFSVIIFDCFANAIGESNLRKCCDANEVFKDVNGTYNCTEDATRRLQINVEETGFWYQNNTGRCVEVSEDFFVFNVTDDVVFPLGPVEEQIFPKCCPLNHIYNSVIHSCEKKQNENHTFDKKIFFRIGLPNCRVIVDHELTDGIDFEYGLQDSTRALHRRNNVDSINSYCIDRTQKDSFILRECKDSLEVCEDIRCFKKCCPDGQSFIDGSSCFDTYKYGLNFSRWASHIENPTDPYAIIHGTCETIFLMNEEKYHFNIDSNGVFSFYTNNTSIKSEDIGDMSSYCMEHTLVENSGMNDFYMFKCFGDNPDEKFSYTLIGLIMSSVSLILTIAVYVILNEVKKIFGKILVLYCVAMLLLSATLAYTVIHSEETQLECQIIAFVIILFGAASFSWSNILCWDIWRTFGSTRNYIGTSFQKTKDMTKILFYILYGWGIPFVLTMLILLFYEYDDVLPDSIQPVLGEERCFFEKRPNNYAKPIFFLLPLLLMELANIFLFLKTASYCWKVRQEINKINDTTKNDRTTKYKRDKERLFLILKLSIITGVSYIFEVLSGFFEMSTMGKTAKYIELVWDLVNSLQGVYIFLIFICKRKVLNALLNKLINARLPQVSTATQSSQTNGVSLQTVDSVATKNGK